MAGGRSAIERDTFIQTLKMLKHSIDPFSPTLSPNYIRAKVICKTHFAKNSYFDDFLPLAPKPLTYAQSDETSAIDQAIDKFKSYRVSFSAAS